MTRGGCYIDWMCGNYYVRDRVTLRTFALAKTLGEAKRIADSHNTRSRPDSKNEVTP